MSKEKRRVPKLRFPGFTEDWEQRKLSEVVAINPKTELPDEFKYVDLESVVGTNLLGFQVIKKENAPSRAQRLASYGDVFYQTVRPYQRNNYLFENVDKDMVFSTGYAQLRSRLDSYFLLTLVQNDNFVKVVLDNCTGTSYPAINGSELGKITVQIPPNEVEANQIGKIFRRIDKSITLHQRKLNNLKLKKKALLQKLFPKNGERYPELRFPGFTDAWEQRKLNEFLSVSNLKNAENKYNKKDVLSVSGDYGIVNQIDFQGRSFAGASVSNYGVVEKGDIVYTKSPLKLNPYGIIKTNRLNNGIVSTLYAIYKTKENCDSKFIEHYFNLDSRLNQYLKPLVNKGAKNDMKVSSENALIGEVCFPKITEQVLIADLLDCLDIYITLHQRKLEHLQLQKKALLQQMFV